jgi:hypothetical protein
MKNNRSGNDGGQRFGNAGELRDKVANDNLSPEAVAARSKEAERIMARHFTPRTLSGNPVEYISGKWLGDEDCLHTGQSKEGFHAQVVKVGDEHKLLVWGKAFPTIKGASQSALEAAKETESSVLRFARPNVGTERKNEPPKRSR